MAAPECDMGRLDSTNRRRRVSVAPKRVSIGFGNSFKLKFHHGGPLWFLRMCEQHHASRTATFFPNHSFDEKVVAASDGD